MLDTGCAATSVTWQIVNDINLLQQRKYKSDF